jgi:hypothetical protein
MSCPPDDKDWNRRSSKRIAIKESLQDSMPQQPRKSKESKDSATTQLFSANKRQQRVEKKPKKDQEYVEYKEQIEANKTSENDALVEQDIAENLPEHIESFKRIKLDNFIFKPTKLAKLNPKILRDHVKSLEASVKLLEIVFNKIRLA